MAVDPRLQQAAFPPGMTGPGAPAPAQGVATPAQGVMAPAQRPPPPQGQDMRRDNPQLEERERALIANKLGTVRDFGDDRTAYFRAVEDFRTFAKQLGVDREKLPDVNLYLMALGEAADYYRKSGRWQEMLESLTAGREPPPY